MNRVLLYINEVLVSLDIPPIIKTTDRRFHNFPRRKSKSKKEISKDNIK